MTKRREWCPNCRCQNCRSTQSTGAREWVDVEIQDVYAGDILADGRTVTGVDFGYAGFATLSFADSDYTERFRRSDRVRISRAVKEEALR